jgi:hypothetical protein
MIGMKKRTIGRNKFMFIKRTKYEKEIRKAEKRGFKKAMENRNVENSFDALNQNMWNQFDKINTTIDIMSGRLDKIEGKSKHDKTK